MLSEKYYWLALIIGLLVFLGIDCIFILPSAWDIGVNLLTDAIFTIFTIVFLTWMIKQRETNQWRIVEKKVLERIGRHIERVFNATIVFFPDGSYPLSKDVQKRMDSAKQLDDETEKQKTFRSLLIEQIADDETFHFGEWWKGKLGSLDRELMRTISNRFRTEKQFLEMLEDRYSRFLRPELTHSLMEIEDSLHKITAALDMLELKNKLILPVVRRRLQTAIQRITKEMCKIEGMGIEIPYSVF